MRVKESKILFLDSRAGHQLNHKSRINFPSESFSAKGNELIRLTLLEFNLKRTFYNINSTNNKFFIRDGSTDREVIIPEGNYSTGAELATAIQSATTSITTCVFDDITEKLTVTLANTVDVASYLYSTKIKDTPDKFYNTHDVLGGLPTLDDSSESTLVEMFDIDLVNTRVSVSKYPIQLQTINQVLLKTNLQTNNFQSKINLPDKDMASVVNSQLFASIPVPENTTDKLIKFVDSNNTFQMYLQTKNLNSITLDIEDVDGNTLPALDNQQYSSGNLHYSMVLKYEVIDPEVPSPILGNFRGNYETVINR